MPAGCIRRHIVAPCAARVRARSAASLQSTTSATISEMHGSLPSTPEALQLGLRGAQRRPRLVRLAAQLVLARRQAAGDDADLGRSG